VLAELAFLIGWSESCTAAASSRRRGGCPATPAGMLTAAASSTDPRRVSRNVMDSVSACASSSAQKQSVAHRIGESIVR
jgi:hypothetical protein